MSRDRAQLILASASARRAQLLSQMGLRFEIAAADIDETFYQDESPADYVCRVALKKAQWIAERKKSQIPVLAADTVVVLDGQILGKPADPTTARTMLLSLSGRTHEVFSAVVLLTHAGVQSKRLSVSQVTFADLHSDWLAAYCQCTEPLDKAGAYAIQGLAAEHISRLEGSYSGVMGLPLFETMELIRLAGIQTHPGVDLN